MFSFYVLLWTIMQLANILLFFPQHAKLDSVYKFITIAIYVAMAIVEILRLYLGYAGNLQEKVHPC